MQDNELVTPAMAHEPQTFLSSWGMGLYFFRPLGHDFFPSHKSKALGLDIFLIS